MNLKASEIMNAPAITAHQDCTVGDLMKLLDENSITGVPVVDDDGTLVGVVSITDLLALGVNDEAEGELESDFHTSPAMDGLSRSSGFLVPDSDMLDRTVRTIMSQNAITATLDAAVGDLADTMVTHNVHRIIIVKGDKPKGIVSVKDILHALRTPDGKPA